MNKKYRILAGMMALALCAGALTACGSNSGNNSGNSGNSSVTDNSGTEDGGSETTVTINTVAEVTAINEDGSLELKVYSGSGNIADFAAVDFSQYTATEETETLTIPDESVLSTAADGALTAAALSDVAVGDMLVISQDIDTDAVLQVVRYAAAGDTAGNGEDTGAEDGSSADSETAGEDAAA